MSTATFTRVHNWGLDEVIKSADLNAEFNNILNNLNPPGVGSYSDTVATMKIQTSPGSLGSESLATSLAGELERLRYMLAQITGNPFWYQAPANSLSAIVASLGGSGTPPNRLVSGKTTGNSSQLIALLPAGTTASVTLTASVATPFSYAINGTAYSITASQTLTLAVASSTAATAQVNMTDTTPAFANYGMSKGMGMYGTTFGLQSASGTVGNFVGQICGFKIGGTNTTTEYALGYLLSTAAIVNMWRGTFINNAGTNVKATDLTGGSATSTSVVTLMKLAWIFANTSLSLAVTYDNPVVSAVQPGGPNIGDYWFDLNTTIWKVFNSSTFTPSQATLIGIALTDTGNCVAARTFNSYAVPNSVNEMSLTVASTSGVQAVSVGSRVAVNSILNDFQFTRPSWPQTSLDTGVVMSASTNYFLYMKENGNTVVSDFYPIYRGDLLGYYHPGEMWRALGSVLTDTSTAFQAGSLKTFRGSLRNDIMLLDSNFYGTAGYTSVTNSSGDGTYSLPTRFASGVYAFTVTAATSAIWFDVATVSVTPGLWKQSGTMIVTNFSGTADACYVDFSIAPTQGSTATAVVKGLNSVEGLFFENITGTGTVSVGGTAYTLTCAVTLGNFLGAGLGLSLPNFVAQAGMNQTTFFLKCRLGQFTSAHGTLLLQGSYLFERIDSLTGVSV